ncbi:hypothetical protein TELCIR_22157 [Teladorsagia circumcincta]|uniref:Uncharacterized protein n=1 Tax=Teladorsagia circumcincta TaxID=45464 RepID=A0A2G9TEQ4_TELCI|nr:hypothetical protein TELCIR_22157 [Teladorsagia circumcincta]
MRIEHAVYRQFTSEKLVDKAVGFIDGDLVESLLDMPRETAAAALAGIQRPGKQVSYFSIRTFGILRYRP